MLPNQARYVIAINIETLAGSSFELLVSPYETITTIKRKIERREGIPVSHQHLVWKTQELEDESCLHDYNIGDGGTIKLVLAMRGGPVNTKRVPIEDSLIRDMSEYIDIKEDYGDLFSSGTSNKNVTFLVLRDGDQFNFFQLIDRGDGTLSPMSGSMSTASMYNTHETVDVERDDEKRRAEDKRTKQKMELIKSKLKNTTTLSSKKEPQLLPPRPPSGSKSKTIRQTLTTSYGAGGGSRLRRYGSDRNIMLDSTLSNVNDNEISSTATTVLADHHNNNTSDRKRIPNTISTTNIFNTYNLLSAKNLQEDDEDEDEEEEEDDSNDEENDSDEYKTSSMITTKKLFGSTRSFSPSILSNGFFSTSATAATTPLTTNTTTTKSLSSLKHSLEQQQQQQKKAYQHYHDKKKVSMAKREATTTKTSVETLLTNSYPSMNLGLSNQDITNSQETATNDLTNFTSSKNDLLLDYIHRLSPTQSQPISPSPCITCSAKRLSDQTQPQSTLYASSGNVASCGTTTTEIYHHLASSTALDLDDETIGTTNNYASLRKLQQSPYKCLHSSLSNSNDSYLRKQTAGSISNTGGDHSNSRNETSLSKWPDTPSPQSKLDGHFGQDDDIIISEQSNNNERTLTSHSLFRHQNSSTSTITPTPTLPNFQNSAKKTQQRYHHTTNSTSSSIVSFDQQRSSPSLNVRPLVPLTLSKYRRMPPASTNAQQGTTYSTSFFQHQLSDTPSPTTNDWFKNTTATTQNDSFNEHLMLNNKRIEMLKAGKQQSPMPPSPSSSSTAIFPPPSSIVSTKRDSNNENNSTTKPVISSTSVATQSLPYDSTKVTIETIGSKTVTALLRQNATIEPVDTSRGVGRHLVSLLTTASKETSNKGKIPLLQSQDTVIEERYKLDAKLNPWSTTSINGSTISSLNSTTATIYSNTNPNKLPPVIISRKSTAKCFLCKKKTGLATTYSCRCGSSFCSEHRYPEAHNCPYDYKAEGKRLIERNNPVVAAPKLPKI